MKSRIFIIILIVVAWMAQSAEAQQAEVAGATIVPVSNVQMERNGNYMKVSMDIDVSNVDVPSNRAVLIVPSLVGEGQSVDLKSVGVFGRNRYFHYLRNYADVISEQNMLACYKSKTRPSNISYEAMIPFEKWQEDASLNLSFKEYGCADCLIADSQSDLGKHYEVAAATPFVPELIFVKAKAENEKVITFSGSAYVDFPVNQTVIYEDYRNNAKELGKIRGLIDTLKMENEVQISHVTLKGFASPEGPYNNNVRLAKGRVEALKTYVDNIYDFAPGLIQTSYEPEDWEGLRAYVESSNMANKQELLEVIDSDLQPDAKDARLKSRFPSDYAFLLQHVYPALRHTNYSISCGVKKFSDPVEIRAILEKDPKLLSLDEIYLLANTYEPGSDEFNDLYETAVRLFPNDEIANLNVANVAIRRGELDKASDYLNKVSDCAEKFYAQSMVAYMKGDTDEAERLMNQSRQSESIAP